LNKGKLISIDYLARPEQTKEKVGAAIPSHLRKRQQLFLDRATRVLKKLTQNSLKVDIFLHDSIHTYHNMIEEFDIIWPHIKKKGFLLSDDVTDNDAFLDFADRMQKKPFIISYKKSRPFGLIQK